MEKYTMQGKRTFKSYWINFWYYHKGAFWLIMFFLVAIIISINPFGDHTKPDYTVGLITTKSWSTQHQQRLEKVLAAYGDDLNGDGKVVVEVSYMLQPEDSSVLEPTEYQTYLMKVYSNFEAGDIMIYLIDNFNLGIYGLNEQLFSRLDGTYSTLPEDVDVKDYPLTNIGVPWMELDGISKHPFFCRSTSEMYFCYRAVVPALNEDALALRDKTLAFFQRIEKNEPRDPALLAEILSDAEYEYASSTAAME